MNQHEWVPVEKMIPFGNLIMVDVTIETPQGDRLDNVAMFRSPKRWEILIDKHHFYDCKIIAWKKRTPVYSGDSE